MGAGQGRAGNPGGGQPPAPMPPVNQNQPPDLTKMTDDELADFIGKWTDLAWKQKLPPNLNENDPTQTLIYGMGWNDKPEILQSRQVEALAKKGALALYRTVTDNGSISAAQIIKNTLNDDVFQTGAKNSRPGTRCYGGGMYMADVLNDSTAYGGVSSKSYAIGAVLNKNAKIITMKELKSRKGEGAKWLQAHPNAALKLGFHKNPNGNFNPNVGINKKISTVDLYTSLAAVMGYNVVDNNNGYYTVLNRKAITTSNKNYYDSQTNMSGGRITTKG